MYKATCAECGKDTEVPFQPQEGRRIDIRFR
ncbi:MAG: zinc-binding protein, partial [Candidatus Parvarchaeota archaeon]|nr:zinc-binding protein [Candidatus Parvarchaeota archaeon]